MTTAIDWRQWLVEKSAGRFLRRLGFNRASASLPPTDLPEQTANCLCLGLLGCEVGIKRSPSCLQHVSLGTDILAPPASPNPGVLIHGVDFPLRKAAWEPYCFQKLRKQVESLWGPACNSSLCLLNCTRLAGTLTASLSLQASPAADHLLLAGVRFLSFNSALGQHLGPRVH